MADSLVQEPLDRIERSPRWLLIGVSGVPEGDPVSNDLGATEEPGSLDGVLSEPVADCIDSPLQALATRWGRVGEEIHLSGVRFA